MYAAQTLLTFFSASSLHQQDNAQKIVKKGSFLLLLLIKFRSNNVAESTE